MLSKATRGPLSLVACAVVVACAGTEEKASFPDRVLPEASYATLPQLTVDSTEALCADDDACELFWSRALAISPDGDVVFLGRDGKQPQLFLRDAATVKLTRLGRVGSGPGEYMEPWRLGFTSTGDVVAFDGPQFRLSRYSREGSVREMGTTSIPGGFIDAWFVDAELRFLAAERAKRTGDSTAVAYLAVDSATGKLRTLSTLPTRGLYYNIEDLRPAPPAYSAHALYDVRPDGLIAYTRGERMEIDLFDASGARRLRFGLEHEPRKVTKADLQAALGRSLMGVRDPQMRRWITERAKTGEGAGRHPAITRLVALDDGAVWVRESPREAQDSVQWVQFDSASKPTGRLLLASDDILLAAHGGRILMSSSEGERGRAHLRWIRLRASRD